MTLIGGLAVAYYVNPPVTVDVDFLVFATTKEISEYAQGLTGWGQGPLMFTSRTKGMPKGGVRLSKVTPPEAEVDLISCGSDEYLQSVVLNSPLVEVQPGFTIKVIRPEDLVVMKTLVGRDKDIDDTVEIMSKLRGKIDETYIETVLEQLF